MNWFGEKNVTYVIRYLVHIKRLHTRAPTHARDRSKYADDELFNKIVSLPNHVLHALLPPPSTASQNYNLRHHTHYNCLHTPRSYRTLHLLHECCIKIHIRHIHIFDLLLAILCLFIVIISLYSLRSVKLY